MPDQLEPYSIELTTFSGLFGDVCVIVGHYEIFNTSEYILQQGARLFSTAAIYLRADLLFGAHISIT